MVPTLSCSKRFREIQEILLEKFLEKFSEKFLEKFLKNVFKNCKQIPASSSSLKIWQSVRLAILGLLGCPKSESEIATFFILTNILEIYYF